MRTTIVLLAMAVLAVAVLGACRARDNESSDTAAPDTAAPDTAGTDDTASGIDSVTTDSASVAASTLRQPARATPAVRRTVDSAQDSTLPPDDSIRALRPEMPQVTPEKRPRTWRGFKLPEEMPVRAPVETIKRVEQAPESVRKGDLTKPPTPNR